MPELPEVETIRLGLSKKVIGKPITSFQVKKNRLVRNNPAELERVLLDNQIDQIGRIGKLLIFQLKSGHYLMVHLKMTGQLIYIYEREILAGGHSTRKLDIMPSLYSYVIFGFNDGSELHFNDMRQFGYISLADEAEKARVEARFGLEPLTKKFTIKNFSKIFSKRTGILKAVLLNQQIIAGIGNIYADEICFRAGVLPNRKISFLRPLEIVKLYKATQSIIKKAIEQRGTTFNNYRDSDNNKGNYVNFLKVYGRAGMKCLRCKKNIILKTKVAGRGTCFCPQCQK